MMSANSDRLTRLSDFSLVTSTAPTQHCRCAHGEEVPSDKAVNPCTDIVMGEGPIEILRFLVLLLILIVFKRSF